MQVFIFYIPEMQYVKNINIKGESSVFIICTSADLNTSQYLHIWFLVNC